MNKLYLIQIVILLLISNVVMSQSNYSLLFDGKNDYVEFPFTENHDLFDDFSIEMWLKFDAIPIGRILSKAGWFDPGDSVSSYSIYFDEINPLKIGFSTWVSQFPNIEHKSNSTLPLNSNQWNHIAVTYTEATNNKKIYINGVLTFSEDNTGDIGYNGRPLFIGAFKTNLGDIIFPFKGNIDEVRIWQKALTKSEVVFNMYNTVVGSENNLLGLWHFNEGVGDTLYDSSVYSIEGVICGATWVDGYVITSIDGNNQNVDNYKLFQNYPNPFNPNTNIDYTIFQSGFVELSVFNILGQKVASLVSEEQIAGNYKISFNASNLTSGIYYYKLQSGNFTETKKLILLR